MACSSFLLPHPPFVFLPWGLLSLPKRVLLRLLPRLLFPLSLQLHRPLHLLKRLPLRILVHPRLRSRNSWRGIYSLRGCTVPQLPWSWPKL